MANAKLKKAMQDLFGLAGVKIDGKDPWDIRVHNDDFYQKVLAQGSLGLGEAYMDGWWDCEKLDEFFYRVIKADLRKKVKARGLMGSFLKAKLINLQNKSRAFQVGEAHYDIGNNLYQNMLDKRMVYTCGYWDKAGNLDQAQEEKLELICKKIGIKEGMKILDIGCGWGSFAKYAAEKHKAEVVGITISREQAALGNRLCAGLPVEIRLQDYRDVKEKFDAIVSVGMFEHVGPKNYRTYMKIARDCLKDGGLFLLHTIGVNTPTKVSDRWMDKYIFPNGVLPSVKQVVSASEGLLSIEDWHNFGADYDKTLMAWHQNFKNNWQRIKENYDERFRRMWEYYLLMCAGAFRSGSNKLWQIVFSKSGIEGGYRSVR